MPAFLAIVFRGRGIGRGVFANNTRKLHSLYWQRSSLSETFDTHHNKLIIPFSKDNNIVGYIPGHVQLLRGHTRKREILRFAIRTSGRGT